MRRMGIAAIALGGLTATAQAGDMPALELRWRVDNHDPMVITPFGTDFDGDGVWNYFGFAEDPGSGVTINWNLNADASLGVGVRPA